jgi:hypothetical protein
VRLWDLRMTSRPLESCQVPACQQLKKSQQEIETMLAHPINCRHWHCEMLHHNSTEHLMINRCSRPTGTT